MYLVGWRGGGRKGYSKETTAVSGKSQLKHLFIILVLPNKSITPALVTPLKLTHEWQKEVMSSISSPVSALLLPLSSGTQALFIFVHFIQTLFIKYFA